MVKFSLAFVVIALVAPSGARAAASCAGLLQPATRAARTADAALVSTVGRQKVQSARVAAAAAEGRWRIVFATPPQAERGVFFFRRDADKRFKLVDVWGGVIPPDERAATIRWVGEHYGSPPRLTACMVDLVIAGE